MLARVCRLLLPTRKGTLLLSSSSLLYLCSDQDRALNRHIYQDLPASTARIYTRVYKKIYFVLKTAYKVVQIFLHLLPLSLGYLVCRAGALSRESLFSWLRYSLVQLGPCWVKLGQWAATRADLFEADLCRELSRLHSYVYTHAWSATETALIRSFGPDYPTWLSINQNPVNSGAVGQVYRGVMKEESRGGTVEVAVKVLHPNIRVDTEVDLYLLGAGASLLELFPPLRWLDPRHSVEHFGATMRHQLNLMAEHENLAAFRRNFAEGGNVRFPEPFRSSSDVIIESFEESTPISTAILTGSEEDRRVLARTGIRMFFKMVFEDNLIHGDLHPGNLLVSRDHPDRLVVLDVGMTTQLEERHQRMLYPLLRAFLKQDYDEVCWRLLQDAPSTNCPDPALFVREMSGVVREVADTRLILRKLDVSRLILRFLGTLQRHQVQLESGFISTILAVLVLEGVGRSLDPDLDILQEAAPFLLTTAVNGAVSGAVNGAVNGAVKKD